MFNENIFKTYDIRGVVGKELDSQTAELIGRSLGTLLLQQNLKKCVVGRDNRLSSPDLSKNFINGLLSTGCDVVDIGLSITPIIHFLTCTSDFDAGVIVTASHNPKEYNGFRIDYANAVSFYGKEIQKIKDSIITSTFILGEGKYEQKDLAPSYQEYIKKKFNIEKRFRVVVDCGNGTSSFFAPFALRNIGCEVVDVYCRSDGNYPHGIPDPENRDFMKEVSKLVMENNADVGFTFDTDDDRFGVVDNKGVIYENDKLLLLFAKEALKENPNVEVVYDVKSSGILEQEIKNFGGVSKMIRTGHPFFIKEMVGGALLGGEYSGHMFFGKDYFGYDDGIYAACRLLTILDKTGKSLNDLMSIFPKLLHTTEVKIPCLDSDKEIIMTSLVKKSKKYENVSYIDGIRIKFSSTGWFLIRASNTSPYLSFRVEGKDKDEVSALISEARSLLGVYKSLNLELIKNAQVYVS